MTEPSSERDRQRSAAIARALADPKRLCVLESLSDRELSVSELSVRVGCQVPNMSQHLAVLRAAGLVSSRRVGSTVFYRLADRRVVEALQLIRSLAGSSSDDRGEPVDIAPAAAGERIAR